MNHHQEETAVAAAAPVATLPVPLSAVVSQHQGDTPRTPFRARWQSLEVWVTYVGERTATVSTAAMLEEVERSTKTLVKLDELLVDADGVEWIQPTRGKASSWRNPAVAALNGSAEARTAARAKSDDRALKDQASKQARAKTKVCRRCGKEKPAEDFGRHAQTHDGLQPQCRACRGVVMAASWAGGRRKRATTKASPGQQATDAGAVVVLAAEVTAPGAGTDYAGNPVPDLAERFSRQVEGLLAENAGLKAELAELRAFRRQVEELSRRLAEASA